MTNPDAPLNLHPSHSATPYDFDALAAKDVNELEPAEAEALAYWRADASLRDYNPVTAAPEDRVVETPDHGSHTLGEIAADESVDHSLRVEAQDRIDEIVIANMTAEQTAAATPASVESAESAADGTDSKSV